MYKLSLNLSPSAGRPPERSKSTGDVDLRQKVGQGYVCSPADVPDTHGLARSDRKEKEKEQRFGYFPKSTGQDAQLGMSTGAGAGAEDQGHANSRDDLQDTLMNLLRSSSSPLLSAPAIDIDIADAKAKSKAEARLSLELDDSRPKPSSTPSLTEFFEREQRLREDRAVSSSGTTPEKRNTAGKNETQEYQYDFNVHGGSKVPSTALSVLTDDENTSGGAQTHSLVNMNSFDASTIATATLQAPQPQPTKRKQKIPSYHDDVDDTIMELETSIIQKMETSLQQLVSSPPSYPHKGQKTSHSPLSCYLVDDRDRDDSRSRSTVVTANINTHTNSIKSSGNPVFEPYGGFHYENRIQNSNQIGNFDDHSSAYSEFHEEEPSENNGAKSATTSSKGEEISIAKNETKRVTIVRWAVFAVLLLSTLGVSAVMFLTTGAAETRRFLDDYKSYATIIHVAFHDQFRDAILSLDNFGLTIQSYSKSTNSKWPFVSIPDWPARVASARAAADAGMLAVMPIVYANLRDSWESFVLNPENNAWIKESEEFEKMHRDHTHDSAPHRLRRRMNDNTISDAHNNKENQEDSVDDSSMQTIDLEQGIPSSLYRSIEGRLLIQPRKEGNVTALLQGTLEDYSEYLDSNVHLPIWMHSPTNRIAVNFDAYSHPVFRNDAARIFMKHEITFGRPLLLAQNDMQPQAVYTCLSTSDTSICNQPASFVTFPVLEDEHEMGMGDSENTHGEPAKRIAALVTQVVYWKDLLQASKLPGSAQGIICVLHNECGDSFTFRVNEFGRIEYSGSGDLHERNYDSLRERVSFDQVLGINEGREDIHQHHSHGNYYFSGLEVNREFCPFFLDVYPSTEMNDRYHTNAPIWFTAVVVAVFIFTSVIFLAYDFLVERRQSVVLRSATRSGQIVAGLFPDVVRSRLFDNESTNEHNRDFEDADSVGMDSARMGLPNPLVSTADSKRRMRSFMNSSSRKTGEATLPRGAGATAGISKPIADLFPHTTVLFADIAGFTAWSSIRDPASVFTLLETVYAEFDALATKRKVFKVETIGDCYVAATGLPEPQKDHAVRMAYFASECLRCMQRLTRQLGTSLGPDTADLAIRTGLHSGPVTAGVLRGQKSRFQLFGDTVNTAARMESNGIRNQIHCSESTAELIIAAGKAHWIQERDGLIEAKGKGKMRTFWIASARSSRMASINSGQDAKSVASIDDSMSVDMSVVLPPPPMEGNDIPIPLECSIPHCNKDRSAVHIQRLIDWNVDLLMKLVTNIIASRMTTKNSNPNAAPVDKQKRSTKLASATNSDGGRRATSKPREEYSESIALPKFNPVTAAVEHVVDPDSVELSEVIFEQLYEYVSRIAHSYQNNNPFHNFEHASHVVMSVNKILNRIVAADECDLVHPDKGKVSPTTEHRFNISSHGDTSSPEAAQDMAHQLHDWTFGITSDPLTQFACAFSALIHDLDHPGVSNSQLAEEGSKMALLYGNKSIAEQHSIDLAWEFLESQEYEDLRQCIFATKAEVKRFRQLVVNSVLATDVFDPELVALRNQRWEKVFGADAEGASHRSGDAHTTDLKATVVIEHIIQAADVAHTMQHWHVYRKWNRRLFEEMYIAYREGRSEKNPADGWFKGELWFFDCYVIPLAKKLKECGVFGVASDEFLFYALQNRAEWEAKGSMIVEDMVWACTGESAIETA